MADELDDDSGHETATDSDVATDEAGSDQVAHNQGRFVTHSDGTAWYAVRLDRDAIADPGPTIAGELTDGSETDDDAVIAAGPVDSSATSETVVATADTDESETDETDSVVAAPPAEPSEDDSLERESTASTTDDPPNDDREAASIDADAEIDETDDGEPAVDSDGDDSVADGDDPATDEGESEPGDNEIASNAFAFEETDSVAESPSDAAVEAEADEEDESETDEAAPDDRPTAEMGLELDDAETDETDAGVAETDADGESGKSDESGLETVDDVSGDEADKSDDEPTVDAADPLAGDVAAFEFDDEDLEDVTVEEAVDTINEEAPAPELSSHRFDVSAEVYGADEDADGTAPDGVERDDGGENTVLTYEFETDTVEISGSTKRLLQYQLRSFADRDATPEADVTIGRNRIVIELPDSDGDAVQRWSEAAVDIIDRTLYLSDNSSDDS